MNEVINRIEERIDPYTPGSIYKSNNSIKYYMLTKIKTHFNKVTQNTICLNDGTYWTYEIDNPCDAITGLEFISNNYKIILENK